MGLTSWDGVTVACKLPGRRDTGQPFFPPRDHDSRQALVRSRVARVARVGVGPAGLVLSCRCEPRSDDPRYLTVTGEAAAEDGPVAAIIGGLPAVEGSVWDIGAPLEDRGAGLADAQGSPPDQASDEHTRSE
jgi:hypothetical protein